MGYHSSSVKRLDRVEFRHFKQHPALSWVSLSVWYYEQTDATAAMTDLTLHFDDWAAVKTFLDELQIAYRKGMNTAEKSEGPGAPGMASDSGV